jgi:hypothetical protein
MTHCLRSLAPASGSRTRHFLARLTLAAAVFALPATGFSQQISGIRVEPESAQAGEPVKITVDFDVEGAINCGVNVLYGDGGLDHYRIASRKQVPLVITRTYSTPGRKVVKVEPKSHGLIGRCGGKSMTAPLMVAAPAETTVAAALPRQESVAAARAEGPGAAPAQGGQAAAASAAANEQRAAAAKPAPAVDGDFVDNKRTGRGSKLWPNGNLYEGDWVNGERHGKGAIVYANGARYDGEWANDTRHGKGVMQYADGGRYEGEWQHNTRTGAGSFVFSNGARYEGDWVSDRRTGKGTYTWPSGDRYQGDFVEGKTQGKGTFTWANGQQYYGDWYDGKRTSGTYTWPNGDRYTGDFVEGKLNTGTMTRANGARQQYVNGTVAQQYAPPAASAAAPAASSPPPRDSREERDSNTNDSTIAILSGLLGAVGSSRQPAARPNAPARPNNPAPAAAIAQAASPSYYQQPQRYSGPGDTRAEVRAASPPSSASSTRNQEKPRQTPELANQCLQPDYDGNAFLNKCGFPVNYQWCRFRPREGNFMGDMFNCAKEDFMGWQTVNHRDSQWVRGAQSILWFACKDPAIPKQVRFDGSKLHGTCLID